MKEEKEAKGERKGQRIKDLLDLRSYCKQLEVQLKYTEFEKLKMAKELSYVGNKEPTRPIFLETLQAFPNPMRGGTKLLRNSRSVVRIQSKSRLNFPTTRMQLNSSSSLLKSIPRTEDSEQTPGKFGNSPSH